MKNNRYLILLVLAFGAVAVYFMPYLRWSFYDTLLEAVQLSNAQFAATMSIYGVTAMIFYAPGGYLADKFSPRKMLAFAFASTGLLGFWYATYPGFVMQMIIFGLWGGIGTAFFWSAMLKVANSLGTGEEQGRMFGLLEGGRGIINVGIAFAALFFYNKLGETVAGITGILIATSVLCLVSALLVWIFVPDKLNGSSGDHIQLKDVGKVLKMPAVWLNAIVVLSCYSVYIGSTYLTPYMTEILGVSASAAAAIAIVRSYVLMATAAPIGGVIADKLGSVTKVVTACFVLMSVALIIFCVLPVSGSAATVSVVLMLVFCIAIFAMRGIYFAPLGQGSIPKSLVGTAIGVVSVIGFFPDVYMNALVGNLMDAFPGITGYKYTFFVMVGFALVGLIASVIMYRMIKKQNAAAQNEATE